MSQNNNEVAYKQYKKAYEYSEEVFGPDDKRTLDYKARLEEFDQEAPISLLDKDKEDEGRASSITKDSILATTYGTFNGTRLKLIIIDYIKDKSLKVYGMKKDGNFVKSLSLPYTMFQMYFQVEGKSIVAQDIRNEGAIEWMTNHINLSEEHRLIFTKKTNK